MKAPSVRTGQPRTEQRRRTTPECSLAQYHIISGPSIVMIWLTRVHQATWTLVTFPSRGVARSGRGGGGTPDPLGYPGPAQAQAGQNGPGSHLDTPNGVFKIGPKAGYRRLQVQDPGDRGLRGTTRSLQSAVRRRITPFRDQAVIYFGALGSTKTRILSHFPPLVPPGSPPGTSPPSPGVLIIITRRGNTKG